MTVMGVMKHPEPLEESMLGHYAGAVTRLAAFVVDLAIAVGAFNIAIAAIAWIVNLITRLTFPSDRGGWWWLIPLCAWLFLYSWYSYALAGKTIGKALFGLKVVRGDGSTLGAKRAALRVVSFPVSWVFFGIGFVGIVLGRRRRAFHDVIADTAVVYDFDARAAHLRSIVRHHERPAA